MVGPQSGYELRDLAVFHPTDGCLSVHAGNAIL
jgi:hypothetical protein